MEVALGECTLRLTSYGVLQPGSALGGCHTLESLRVCFPRKFSKKAGYNMVGAIEKTFATLLPRALS